MTSLLQKELHQDRPFASLEAEVFLNVLKTADVLAGGLAGVLKSADLSATQYNVLRILRGAGEALACGELAQRMITRDPDVTRLLDRLEKRGLIERVRTKADRRVVLAKITADGKRVLKEIDPRVVQTHQRQLGHMSQRKLRMLVRLLEEARGSVNT